MSRYSSSDDSHQPLMWINGRGIYSAHFIVLAYAVTLVVTTGFMAFNAYEPALFLSFNSDRVLTGQVWRLFTYGLWNQPSLLFAIDMLMLLWFGREVEKFFGRRLFLWFYAGLYLLPPLVFSAIGYWVPVTFVGETGSFAVFIAFATLYPNAVMIFDVLAKWAAWVLVGLYSLIDLAYHNWTDLAILWLTSAYAFVFVRREQGRLALPRFSLGKPKSRFHVLTDEKPPAPRGERKDTMAEVDALLEKIARSGIASLTTRERARLDAARIEIARRAPKAK